MIAGLETPTGGPGADRRPGRDHAAAAGAGHRHGVPELRALSAHDRAGEPGLRAPDARRRRRMRSPERVAQAAAGAGAGRRCSSGSPASSPAASGSGSRSAGRSCAIRKVFLFDEPLSNLDAKLRVETRAELARLHRRLAGDDRLRHPRPGGGAHAGGRVIAVMRGRRGGAGGAADGGLPPAGDRVRGGLRRLSGDEPARGRRGRRTVARAWRARPSRRRRPVARATHARRPPARRGRRARRARATWTRGWTWSSPAGASCCSTAGSAGTRKGRRCAWSPRPSLRFRLTPSSACARRGSGSIGSTSAGDGSASSPRAVWCVRFPSPLAAGPRGSARAPPAAPRSARWAGP